MSKKQLKVEEVFNDVLPTYKTSHNARLFPKFVEKFTGVSQTVPDQSMTVSQLVKRFASGLPLSGVKVPLYEGEDALFAGIDFSKLDLAEKEQMYKNLSEQYNDSLTRVRATEKQKAKDEQKRIIDEQVQFELKKAQKQLQVKDDSSTKE